MKSYDELLEASGYPPKDFEDVVRILDSEIRLITPTDPEGMEDDEAAHVEAGTKYYQLTHDYLVHSLRDWLTRKQKETRQGRAELRLAERSALWNSKPENRHLPLWWEYGNIRLLTDKKKWTEPQRKMMTKAGRVHGIRWGTGLALVLVVGIVIQQVVHSTRHRNLQNRSSTAVAAMSTAREILVPWAIEDLKELPAEMVLAELRRQYETADDVRKLSLAYALADFGDVQVEFLVSAVKAASPNETDNLVAALSKSKAAALSVLKSAAESAESESDWRHKARLAILALHLGSLSLAKEMCELRSDPIQRTWFVEEFSSWHGDVAKLAKFVGGSDDIPLRSGVILAVGSLPASDVLPSEKQAWELVLSDLYLSAADTLTHSSAGWSLRKWGLSQPRIAQSQAPASGRNWIVNSIGMTMLKIPAGSFVRKESRGGDEAVVQKVTLTRPFVLCDREVTRAQFQQFMDDPECPDSDKPSKWVGVYTDYSPTDYHPVQRVSWYDVILFCNWLSRREELTPCYERTGKKEEIKNNEYDAWRLIPDANVYRLPTEAEWEYSCRAGTVTTFSFGDDETLLDRYAVYRSSRTELPGSKLPNGWGLFDVHGNLSEWCYDLHGSFNNEAVLTDPMGRTLAVGLKRRVLRGGSFNTNPGVVRSGQRGLNTPDSRHTSYGFRVSRTSP